MTSRGGSARRPPRLPRLLHDAPPRRPRCGAALATALFALVIMAAIADAVLAPALASHRASVRLAAHHAAESEAERGLGAIAGEWGVATWRALETGIESVTVRHMAAAGIAPPGIRLESRVRRLGPAVFWLGVNSSAPLADVPAAAYRSLLLELVKDSVRLTAALTAGGDIELGAATVIEIEKGCDEAEAAGAVTVLGAPDAVVARGGVVTNEGARDTTARSAATYTMPAGIQLASVVREAAVRLSDGTVVTPAPRESAGACVPEPSNWGGAEPEACASYAPVVVGEGDVEVRTGGGQGALVVRGHLTIEGPFHYRGLIVATGGIVTTGGPVTIEGAVLTGPDGDARLHDATAVRASACPLAPAAEATARVVVVPVRGWSR